MYDVVILSKARMGDLKAHWLDIACKSSRALDLSQAVGMLETPAPGKHKRWPWHRLVSLHAITISHQRYSSQTIFPTSTESHMMFSVLLLCSVKVHVNSQSAKRCCTDLLPPQERTGSSVLHQDFAVMTSTQALKCSAGCCHMVPLKICNADAVPGFKS